MISGIESWNDTFFGQAFNTIYREDVDRQALNVLPSMYFFLIGRIPLKLFKY